MKKQDILIVDGYNMIGAWDNLNALKKSDNIQEARDLLLLFELSNYKKYRGIEIIVVFDAQLVPGITQKYEQYSVEVIFTKEGETADEYIEKIVSDYLSPLNRVVVATSDATEQWVVFQKGAMRQSANELWLEIVHAKDQIKTTVKSHYNNKTRRRSPWKNEDLEALDKLRREIEGKDS